MHQKDDCISIPPRGRQNSPLLRREAPTTVDKGPDSRMFPIPSTTGFTTKTKRSRNLNDAVGGQAPSDRKECQVRNPRSCHRPCHRSGSIMKSACHGVEGRIPRLVMLDSGTDNGTNMTLLGGKAEFADAKRTSKFVTTWPGIAFGGIRQTPHYGRLNMDSRTHKRFHDSMKKCSKGHGFPQLHRSTISANGLEYDFS